MSARYQKSENFLERARRTIPLGAQTFSKSFTQYPYGVSPYFASHARGSKLWDIDGNEYIDFVNGLASVTLGYCDPDVDSAVRAQLEKGTIFTLSHELEAMVAEQIVDMVPSAEMVRFGKNGSDATAGAVRLARAHTGRDHLLVCGYHGWQDWYIGTTTKDRGIPAATKALTHTFTYNDIEALESAIERLKGKVAAIILEPMNSTAPKPGYLQAVRDIATRNEIVLIFDETITGFRYAKGGAQELFGVIPDLTTLGKGIANGFPLSAVAGRRDLMMLMEEVFFSFTMGGEALSLAAAHATLNKIQRLPVVQGMRTRGFRLYEGLVALVAKHSGGSFFRVSGDPTWIFVSFADVEGIAASQIKTLWLQEMLARGILTIGTHNMSFAHSDEDIDCALAVYDQVLAILHDAVAKRAVNQYLRCDPLVPLFKVR